MHPPFRTADNAGPFTLDGTRTYRVGQRRTVLVDPGPDVDDHVRALASWVEDAEDVSVAVTHKHSDHAGAALRLAETLGAPILGPGEVAGVDRVLVDGDTIETDEGSLMAVHTPGHTSEHLSFHWLERNALFAGDLLLGRGNTTWVAEYPGCVADYLEALKRVRELDLQAIYPAHGPPLEDVSRALDRFERHRRRRIEQVREALENDPVTTTEAMLLEVYGDALPDPLRGAATQSLQAILDHVKDMDRG